jgi:hypothetical protein
VTTQTVLFDRELRHLDPEDAEAWRAWLTQHQLDRMSIACPSQLVYKQPKSGKPTLTVELVTRDPLGALRSKKTVYFSGPVVPFPGGYRVVEAARSNDRRGSLAS